MEPVEIEIKMRQNVDKEAAKASEGVSGLASASEKARAELLESISIQQTVIKKLRDELEPLQAAFDKVNVGTNDPKVIAEKQKLSAAVKALKAELNGEEKALEDLVKQSDKYTAKTKTLESQIRDVREQMAALKLAGKGESKQYRELEEKLGLLGTAYREVYNEQKALSTGGTQMAGLLSGLSALSGAISTGAGAIGLFNGNSEDMEKIQTRIQSLMAITIGLQQVSNALHQTSAFRITTVTKAKQLWASSTQALSVQLGISNLAAKALMATLTLGLSAAITGIIYLIDRYVTSQRKAREETKKFTDAVASSAAEPIAQFTKLHQTYKALGDDIKAQERFVNDNQDAFKALGIAVNDVNEANRLFSEEGKTAFVDSIMERAKAVAAMELAGEKYKEIITKMAKADSMSDTVIKTMTFEAGKPGGSYTYEAENKDKKRLIAEIEKDQLAFQELIEKSISYDSTAQQKLKEAGVGSAKSVAEYTKAYWEQQKKSASERLAAMKDFEKGSAEWNKAVSDYNRATEKLRIWDFSGKQDKKSSDAAGKLRKMSVDLQSDIDAATIAAMKDGAERRLAEVNAEYAKRKALIQQKLDEIAQLEKEVGAPATQQRAQIKVLSDAEEQKYKAEIDAVNSASAQAVAEMMDEVNSRFRTDLENQLRDIEKNYKERQKLLVSNIKDKAALDKKSADLEAKRLKEREVVVRDAALREIDFATEIELRKQEIANREVLFEADKQKNLLIIQRNGYEARLRQLRKLQEAGVDVAEAIADAEAGLAKTNAALDDNPGQKMRELADYTSMLASALKTVSSAFDESTAKAAEFFLTYLDGAKDVVVGATTSNPAMIASGVLKELELAIKVLSAGRNARKEIAEFNYKLSQQAIQYSLALIRSIKDMGDVSDSIFNTNFSSSLTNAMGGYNAALAKQAELMTQLGDVTVKTGVERKKFLGITYSTEDIYKNLLKTYPDLIAADGTLNKELAQTLLQSGNLSKEAANLINNILSADAAAAEAMSKFEQELSSMVGSLGSELKAALDDAFKSGTDAAQVMTESIGKMIENLATQKLFSAVFGPLLKDLEEEMKGSYGAGGDADITDDLARFLEKYPQLMDAYMSGLAALKETLKNQYDLDVLNPEDNRKGTTRSLAQASQDSIDLLSGRVLALSINVADIRNFNLAMLSLDRELLLHTRTMSQTLDRIADNTEYCKYLYDVKNSLDDIKDRGIKVKT